MPNLKEIIKEYLEQHGYDGLYNPSECACDQSDLMPCDEPGVECRPGYREDCDPGKCGEHEFHICAKKPGG
jgi:hypothetical protein